MKRIFYKCVSHFQGWEWPSAFLTTLILRPEHFVWTWTLHADDVVPCIASPLTYWSLGDLMKFQKSYFRANFCNWWYLLWNCSQVIVTRPIDKSTLVQVMAWCHQAPSHYRANVDPNPCRYMASLGHNVLISTGWSHYNMINFITKIITIDTP